MDSHTLHRICIVSFILLTLTAVGAAKVDGPNASDGQMVIMDRSGDSTASDASVNQSLLDAHMTDYSVDVAFGSATSDSTGTAPMPESCSQDIEAAQQAAEGQVCTQQIAHMSCPDADVTHEARNGCVISALAERGWEQASMNGSSGEDTRTSTSHTATLEAAFTFRSAGYSVDVSRSVMESYPPQAAFVVNISSPDGPAAEVLTDRSVSEELSYNDTQFQSARVTVVIDGQEAYTRTFRPGSVGAGDEPVDSGRVQQLERRVTQLEQRVQFLAGLVAQEHPELAEQVRNGSTGPGDVTDGPGIPGGETGQQERSGFVNRILGAIFG